MARPDSYTKQLILCSIWLTPHHLHEFLINLPAQLLFNDYTLQMNTLSYQKLYENLKAGHVYRREALLAFTTAIDRDLAKLVSLRKLKKVAPGLYFKPTQSRFGTLPPSDGELVRNFLRDDPFLLYSWNDYNSLGLGLTQLYNTQIVYNRKRHGLFKLGGKQFDFRRPARGFPEKLSKEFLLVDLVNNLAELAEDLELVKAKLKKKLPKFNQKKLSEYVKQYGKIATLKFFKEISHSR